MRRGDAAARLDPQYQELDRRKRIYYANPRYTLVSLGSLATYVQYGISERANTASLGVPMIRMNNLQANGWDLSDLKHIELDDEVLDRYRLLKGDLLFNRTNSKELVGKCEAFDEEGDWVFASYLIRVRLNIQRALPGFVSAFLNSPAGRIQIDQVSRQVAGMSNVNAEELRDLQIPLPDIDEQTRLLAELDAARVERDRALAEAEEKIASIDELVLSSTALPTNLTAPKVFGLRRSQLLGQLTPEPHSVIKFEHAVKSGLSLRNAGDLIRHRTTPAKDLPEEDFAWIRIDDLENRPLSVSKIRVEKGGDISGSLIPVEVGDLLVARLGPTILNSKIVLCPETEQQAIASPEFLVLRVNPRWSARFLQWLLRTNFYRTMMYARSRGGTPSRYRLDAEDFLSLPIPSIPKQQQIEIAALCEQCVDEAIALRAHAETVWQDARELFAQRLLKGDAV